MIKMTVIIFQLWILRPRQGNYIPRQRGRSRCQEAGLALCLSSLGDQNELTLHGASWGGPEHRRPSLGSHQKLRGQGGAPGWDSAPRQAYVWVGHGVPEREGGYALLNFASRVDTPGVGGGIASRS